MTRYRHKNPPDKDRRMAVAVRLTAEGLSLRQAAARLSVSYQTIARDLARWDREGRAMPPAIVRLSRPAVTPAIPPRVKNVTVPRDTDVTVPYSAGSNVIPLRRTA
jgi:hypothetical protein